MLAEIAVGKACGEELKQQEGAPEGLHLGVSKAEGVATPAARDD